MKTIVEYPLEDGGTILVEVEDEAGIARASRAGDLAARASLTFEEAWGHMRPAIRAVLQSLRDPELGTDEVDLEFGVKLTGTTSAVIATAGGEFHFKVTLRCKRAVSPVDPSASR